MIKMATTRKVIFAAMFAAICCVATMVPKIPTPMGGYVHCGDAVVLLGAFLLGPFWGAAAAGIGSALADVVSGYVIYAPGTLIIKAVMALSAGFILRRTMSHSLLWSVAAAFTGEAIMVLGYFVFEAWPLGFGLACAVNIPFNCIQGVFGVAASVALYAALIKIPYVKTLIDHDADVK